MWWTVQMVEDKKMAFQGRIMNIFILAQKYYVMLLLCKDIGFNPTFFCTSLKTKHKWIQNLKTLKNVKIVYLYIFSNNYTFCIHLYTFVYILKTFWKHFFKCFENIFNSLIMFSKVFQNIDIFMFSNMFWKHYWYMYTFHIINLKTNLISVLK